VAVNKDQNEVYWRFNAFHRFIHLVMMVTFIGLALTGLPIKYPSVFWARGLVSLWGGVKGAGFAHRCFAAVTFGYFFPPPALDLLLPFRIKRELFGAGIYGSY
jgi:cytochrome b subunit of formate dehydrogenase